MVPVPGGGVTGTKRAMSVPGGGTGKWKGLCCPVRGDFGERKVQGVLGAGGTADVRGPGIFGMGEQITDSG